MIDDQTEVEHRPSLGARRLIGQGAGAAFVRVNGEIDWWCPGRFDAAPVLWSLLDGSGGCARWLGVEVASWEARPAGATTRTTLRIGRDTVDVWDGLLAVEPGVDVLVRLVRSARRPVHLIHELRLGGFDAPLELWREGAATESGRYHIVGEGCHDACGPVLRTTLTATPDAWRGFGVVAGRAGAEVGGSLLERMGAAATLDSEVARHVRLPRHHAERAIDAMQVLRTLTDRDTGAPVAAATTSLPEAPGGTRQFDYRFTWLRDSAYAVATAALFGHLDASSRYLGFLERIVDRYGDELTPLTTTTGDPAPAEREIVGVRGWAGSRPVRVGNEASEQRQIDAVSTILEAIWVHVRCGGRAGPGTWRLVEHIAGLVVNAPRGPSSGIWEFRDERPLVTEELARWIGLRHALRLRRVLRPWVRKPEWIRAEAEARSLVEAALDPVTGMLPQSFDGEPVADAATLLAATNRFFGRRDPRLERLVRATIAALEEGPFLRRYPASVGGDDGFEGREACFVPASWWAVSALCAIGDLDEATRRADAMCAVLPPVQSEQWDVERGESLGNAPLLWSNTEMARALFNLHSLHVRRRYGAAGEWLWHAGRFVRQRFRPRPEPLLAAPAVHRPAADQR